jgi:hypothetical protein
MLNERGIKESFEHVKNDISSLNNEVIALRNDISSLKQLFLSFEAELNSIKLHQIHNDSSEKFDSKPTQTHKNSTDISNPTDNPTVPHEIWGLNYPKTDSSTRNWGVPTNQQTNKQTDISTDLIWNKHRENTLKFHESSKSLKQHILDAAEILNSLDNLRKEVRIKFKSITNQEMLVFSTIYELEQIYPGGIEYEQIALKLKLSSSSIRDYVQKLINKGVPILKKKVNNKKILLKISDELKKIATLDTIIKLREL